MIHKSHHYGGLPDVTLVEFGSGTVTVGIGLNTDHVSLLLKTQEAREIGQTIKVSEGATSDDYKPEVVMAFHNVESLDVVLDFLQKIRQELIARQPKPIRDVREIDVVTEGKSPDDSKKDMILGVVRDLAMDFIVYDRDEDEDLQPWDIQHAIADGKITVHDIVKEFEHKVTELIQPR